MPETTICANCSAVLDGEYCAGCGQRRFRPEDRRFAHLAGQFFSALTDLDSRFWRSLKALLFRPGLLSRDYIAGRRAYWMSPVALFLLANLLYFVAPAISDFDLPLRNQVSTEILHEFDATRPSPMLRDSDGGQMHSRFTAPWVRARLARLQAELDAQAAASSATPERAFDRLERDYNRASANFSKLLIVLHVPFMALGLILLMHGTRRYFAEHFVVGLHYFTFLLFFVELALLPGAWFAMALGVTAMPFWVKFLSGAILHLYAALALRRAYDCGWPRAIVAGFALLALVFAINVSVYRALQFAIVLALA